ncbi:zinc ribbon domain-containing protein [Thalassotalea sp. ND16A]|uniref:zinc ribbon domain-containing protein n=1 Tax=Thalassotalea sp. ND16A TaxID=1535422 RepID=UPI000689F55B|nr:zinc ribbon domain-containing protein [Thalassotalea sp. ND16A]
MTISRRADKWYVSFSIDVEVSMLPSESQARCGVDLGINKLARHIADVGCYEVRRQLEYKSAWFQRTLTIANRWFPSSKLCSDCGSKNSDLALSQRTYQCACGNSKCRDYNASINLENYTARSAEIYAAGDNGSALAT